MYEAEDGILLLGKETDLAGFDSVEGAVSRHLTGKHEVALVSGGGDVERALSFLALTC